MASGENDSATQPRPSGHKKRSGDDEQAREPSTLYKLVVTPVTFVSFLLSLVIVDLRYSRVRVHSHAEAPSRLPGWLRTLLFHPQPYSSLPGERQGPPSSRQQQQGNVWHYHSNQRKLMEMEATEAFEIRNTVLVVLALMAAAGMGATWYAATKFYHHWYP